MNISAKVHKIMAKCDVPEQKKMFFLFLIFLFHTFFANFCSKNTWNLMHTPKNDIHQRLCTFKISYLPGGWIDLLVMEMQFVFILIVWIFQSCLVSFLRLIKLKKKIASFSLSPRRFHPSSVGILTNGTLLI